MEIRGLVSGCQLLSYFPRFLVVCELGGNQPKMRDTYVTEESIKTPFSRAPLTRLLCRER